MLDVANKLLNQSQMSTALIIGADVMSRTVDWSDRSSCILFGDGAGCLFIEKGHPQDYFNPMFWRWSVFFISILSMDM